MATTFILGACPFDEHPAQLGRTPDFPRLNRLELDCFQAALIAFYGPPPAGARFGREASTHDFGRYTELTLRFEDGDETALRYAQQLEQGLGRWFHAGFGAPVDYPDTSAPTIHYDDVAAAIESAIRIMRPPFPDGERMIANLRSYYPEHRS